MASNCLISFTISAALSVAVMAAAFGQTKRTREVVQASGVAVEVIAEGRGPLVVLLASLGRDSEEMDPIA
jgi:hypothetical protein